MFLDDNRSGAGAVCSNLSAEDTGLLAFRPQGLARLNQKRQDISSWLAGLPPEEAEATARRIGAAIAHIQQDSSAADAVLAAAGWAPGSIDRYWLEKLDATLSELPAGHEYGQH